MRRLIVRSRTINPFLPLPRMKCGARRARKGRKSNSIDSDSLKIRRLELAAILPCFVPSEFHRKLSDASNVYFRALRNKITREAPMMNDVRDHVAPVETTGKTEKIVAALIVALGFGAVGVFAYETGQGTPQPKVAAVHEQVPA